MTCLSNCMKGPTADLCRQHCVVIFGGLTTVRSSCDLHVLQHQKDVAMLGVRAVKLDNVVVKGYRL